jgi:hypothetical protein
MQSFFIFSKAGCVGTATVVSVLLFYSFQSIQLQLDIVDIAPPPRLARLQRSHDRMVGGVEVFGRMFVFGRITAADMSAFQAQTQMDPAVAHLKAFLAAASVRLHVLDLIEVRARLHLFTPFT